MLSGKSWYCLHCMCFTTMHEEKIGCKGVPLLALLQKVYASSSEILLVSLQGLKQGASPRRQGYVACRMSHGAADGGGMQIPGVSSS